MWLLQNGAEVFCNNNSREWERHYVVHVNNRSGAKILMKILLQQLHHKRLAVFIELFVCSIALVKKCLKDSVILATQEFLIFFTIFTLIGWYWVLVFYRTILTIQSTSFFRDIMRLHTDILITTYIIITRTIHQLNPKAFSFSRLWLQPAINFDMKHTKTISRIKTCMIYKHFLIHTF